MSGFLTPRAQTPDQDGEQQRGTAVTHGSDASWGGIGEMLTTTTIRTATIATTQATAIAAAATATANT